MDQHTPVLSTPAYASIKRRLAASIIDGGLLSIVTYTILYPLLGIQFEQVFTQGGLTSTLTQISSHNIEITLYSMLVAFGYQALMLLQSNGATIGCKLLQIKIKREDNSPLTFGKVLLRYVISVISGYVLSLGYIWAIFDKKKQTWHDKVAGTIVIQNEASPNYFLVILFVILTLLVQTAMFSAAFIYGFTSAYTSATSSRALLYSKAQKESKADSYYKKSQDFFDEMRKTEDSAKVQELNDKNIEVIRQGLQIDENHAGLWYNLASAYTWVSSDNTVTSQDLLDYSKKAYDLDPNDFRFLDSYGTQLVLNQQYDEGIVILNKALRVREAPSTYEYLGKGYAQLGLYDDAAKSYTKALGLYERDNENGMYDNAILSVKKSLQAIDRAEKGMGTIQKD